LQPPQTGTNVMAKLMGWIPTAIGRVKEAHVLHPKYEEARSLLTAACFATLKGEVIVLVGPSRIGKSRCVKDALTIPSPNEPDEFGHMRAVIVEAGNDSKSGEFSTKAFMVECHCAIRHPFFGVPDGRDGWKPRLLTSLDRTPEGTLRAAFQDALKCRSTEYFVVDEAHHVGYAPGGYPAAARILDSYKVLAARANAKLVFTGSYQLLELLELVPHLVGRQRTLEFPRYHASSHADVLGWQQILQAFSEYIVFRGSESLCDWNQYLFEGSLGSIGHLSIWLRYALAKAMVDGSPALTKRHLEQTRYPFSQEETLLKEMVAGERHMLQICEAGLESCGDGSDWAGKADVQVSPEAKRKAHKRKPFERKSRRNKAGARV